MMKSLLLFLALTASVLVKSQESASLTSKLLESFQAKDPSMLASSLAPHFSVAGHTHEGANFRLNQLLNNYPATAIKVVAEKKVAKGSLYNLEFTGKAGKVTATRALVDKAGKLVHIELFDELYGLKRDANPKLRAVIPFTNKNGSIYLQVKINDYARPLQLLFDTGADGMAVSKTLADEMGLKVTRENNASVVGGRQTIQVSDSNRISLDTLQLNNLGIAIFPNMGKEGDGIIGNALLRRYITEIDYDKQTISLYDFGDFQYRGKGTVVAATMPSGVLLIPGDLEIVQGKNFGGQFVFDTGAAYDLICFRPFVRQNKLLVSGFKPEAQASTVSMGIYSPTFIGKSFQFGIAGLPAVAGLPVTLMGGTAQNETWDPGADGSIGIRLLSRYNLTINLGANEIYFSPNTLHSYPADFILRNHQFGWNNQGQLVVLGVATGGQPAHGLSVGTIIASLADKTTEQIRKKPAIIQELKQVAIAESIVLKLTDNTIINL